MEQAQPEKGPKPEDREADVKEQDQDPFQEMAQDKGEVVGAGVNN